MNSKHSCLLLAAGLLVSTLAPAQTGKKTFPTKGPEFSIPQSEVEAHVRFLAADELMGRRTGSPTQLVAARYIAEQFRQLGLKPAGADGSYLQPVP